MEEIQQITSNIQSVPTTGRIVHKREIKQQMDKNTIKISKDAQSTKMENAQNTKYKKRKNESHQHNLTNTHINLTDTNEHSVDTQGKEKEHSEK
jgi:hypothetical protein